jgi:hypothetical protein
MTHPTSVTRVGLTAMVLLLSVGAGLAETTPTCAAGKTGKPAAITGKEAWELASARAHAWQADATPFDLTTTSTGPLDASGKSTDWDVKFSSSTASAVDIIDITDGQIRCFATPGKGGKPLGFDDQIILDTRRLYEIAQKAGGDQLGSGAKVMAGLVPGRRGEKNAESWYLNYQGADGRELLSVIIDARTGAVKDVNHPGK